VGEQSWKPLFRGPTATISEVMRSATFEASRAQARTILEDPAELLGLAERVEEVDQTDAPLAAISDQVATAVRFLRAKAAELQTALPSDDEPGPVPVTAPGAEVPPGIAISAARERLVVAALLYLVTRDDLVPDFQAGGYIDDVLVLSWIFGAAVDELDAYQEQPPVTMS
jgi:hypothetical protein